MLRTCLLAARLVDASPSEVVLDWDAPAACPAEADVVRRTARLRDEASAPVVARVVVREGGEGFVAIVEIDGVAEPREITGRACEDVADAVAIVVAIGSRPGSPDARGAPAARASVPDPERAPDSTPAATVSARRTSVSTAPRTNSPSTPSRRPTLALRLAAGPLVRTMPEVTGAFMLGVAALWRRARLDVVATYALPTTQTTGDVGMQAQSWSVGVRGAWVPRVSIVEFPVSAGVELGGVVARGVGLEDGGTAHGFAMAATVGPGLAVVPHPRVAIGLDPALVLGIVRPRFAARSSAGDVALFQSPVVGVRVLLGIEVRFP